MIYLYFYGDGKMVAGTLLIILSCVAVFLVLVDIGLILKDKNFLNFLHETFFLKKTKENK